MRLLLDIVPTVRVFAPLCILMILPYSVKFVFLFLIFFLFPFDGIGKRVVTYWGGRNDLLVFVAESDSECTYYCDHITSLVMVPLALVKEQTGSFPLELAFLVVGYRLPSFHLLVFLLRLAHQKRQGMPWLLQCHHRGL